MSLVPSTGNGISSLLGKAFSGHGVENRFHPAINAQRRSASQEPTTPMLEKHLPLSMTLWILCQPYLSRYLSTDRFSAMLYSQKQRAMHATNTMPIAAVSSSSVPAQAKPESSGSSQCPALALKTRNRASSSICRCMPPTALSPCPPVLNNGVVPLGIVGVADVTSCIAVN